MRGHRTSLSAIFLEDVLGESESAEQEVEHVFYGKVADANQLIELAKQPFCTKILQEQFQVKLDLGKMSDKMSKTVRVRRVNGEKTVLISKTWVEGQDGMHESKPIEVGDEIFEFFRSLAGEGINKMRYVIQPEGWPRKLEFDLFLDEKGQPTGYGKFDYEVKTEDEKPPMLPITLTDLKHFNPFRGTDADRELMRQFMESQGFRV
jgi:hypothetical protein